MRFKNISRWKISNETDGLLFFAQRMDELLWDYTLDSYKPAALNAPALCREALALISDIESELIDRNNLQYVLEELAWSIKADPVAKNLLDLPVDKYIVSNIDSSVKISDIRRKIEVLERSLEPYRYLYGCFDFLMASVRGLKKKDISTVSRNMVTTLVNMGVSKRFLHEKTNEYFFHPEGEVLTSHKDLEAFLRKISPVSHSFDVYFIVSDLIGSVSESMRAFGMEIIDELPEEIKALAARVNFVKQKGFSYVVISDLQGFDVFSMQERAAAKIDQLSDLFTLFHHREKISWMPNVIVSQCCQDIPVFVALTKGAMDKPFDMPAEKASKEFNRLIRNINFSGASFERFNRVADLHGICVSSDIVENQLVNLWTSLETLIPVRIKGATIINVVDSMLPFLLTAYIKRLVSRLGHDLITWRRWTTKRILNKVDGESAASISQKLLALLCVDSNDALRKELYAELGDFQLLRFRVFSLVQMLSTPESVRKALDEHERKLRWQIRRIYRTRNLIVHSGSKPPYINGLVENGHDYLDLMLFEIMKLTCGNYRASTLEQAFEISATRYERFKIQLAAVDGFDSKNCQFLCDDDNVLSDFVREPWKPSKSAGNVIDIK